MPLLARLLNYLSAHATPFLARLGVAVIIVSVAFIGARLLANLAGRALARAHADAFGSLVRGLLAVMVFGAGILTALDHMGLNVSAVLASAGVLGLAISLGAQAVVRDVISGFFLVLDDVLAPGDRVAIGDITGEVEAVGLRMTRLRSFNGQLWYVPNGEIKTVGNASRGWTRAVVDVGIGTDVDLQRGLEALQAAGERFTKARPDLVMSPPEVHGPTGFNGTEVGLRLAVKVAPRELLQAERELRLYVREAFAAARVDLKKSPT